MRLNDILTDAIELGKRIVVVETPSKDAQKQLGEIKEVVSKVADSELDILIRTPQEIFDGRDSYGNSVVLMASPMPLDLRAMIELRSLKARMQEKSPESDYYVLAEGLDAGSKPLNAALERVGGAILGDRTAFLGMIGMPEETIVSSIKSIVGSVNHGIGARRDARFIGELSRKIAEEGCLQTSEDRTFLFFSDRVESNEGRFQVVKQDTDPRTIDFSKYLAVFVDNNWDKDSRFADDLIGSGVTVLGGTSRRPGIVEEMKRQNVRIPIFYQTAHNERDFSKAIDRHLLEDIYGTIILPKNLAPKVSRSKKVARKELEASRLARRNPHLARYTIETVPIGKEGYVRVRGKDDRFITCSRAASIDKSEDDYKSAVLMGAGLEDSEHNHKMYVLSLFHTSMKDQLGNSDLQQIGKDFFEFDQVRQKLARTPDLESRLDALRKSYEAIVAKHRSYAPTVVCHDDTKWDNWFQGRILGDFGSVSAGREYKDVAEACLQPANRFSFTLDRKNVDRCIDSYISMRAIMDRGFSVNPEEFRRNVYDAIVTESLRIASYKVEKNLVLAEALLKVAETYAR